MLILRRLGKLVSAVSTAGVEVPVSKLPVAAASAAAPVFSDDEDTAPEAPKLGTPSKKKATVPSTPKAVAASSVDHAESGHTCADCQRSFQTPATLKRHFVRPF